MAVLRLQDGTDIPIELPVADALAAISITKGAEDFVELPGPDGPVHIRPSSVIAVLDNTPRGTAGFRFADGG